MEWVSRTLKIVGVVAVCVTLAVVCKRCFRNHEGVCYPERVVDTVWMTRVDTVRLDRPIERLRTVVRVDTVWMPFVDSASLGDSALVVVPLEQTLYTDDSTYRATISGYRAHLDSLVFMRPVRQQIITKTRQARFVLSVGAQAGYYFTPRGWQPGVGVGVGAGVTITFGGEGRRKRGWSCCKTE